MTRTQLLAIVLAFTSASAFAATAQENWDNSCAKCHGADGSASGKVGKKLKIKDYTKAESLKDMTDAQLATAILDGVTKDGKEVMKGFKDELKADDAAALVAFIRGLSAPKKP